MNSNLNRFVFRQVTVGLGMLLTILTAVVVPPSQNTLTKANILPNAIRPETFANLNEIMAARLIGSS